MGKNPLFKLFQLSRNIRRSTQRLLEFPGELLLFCRCHSFHQLPGAQSASAFLFYSLSSVITQHQCPWFSCVSVPNILQFTSHGFWNVR